MMGNVASLLRSIQSTPPDTVVMVAARDGLEVTSDVALTIVGILLVVVMFLLCVLLFQIRRIARSAETSVRKLESQVAPVVQRAGAIAENVNFISAVLRTDVEKLSESMVKIKTGLDEGATQVHERVQEFNALIEVVQGEAEEIFLDAASTVRGVKAGAREWSGETTIIEEAAPHDPSRGVEDDTESEA